MSWWQYLLLVNIYLVLFYVFYILLLRKETFFQLNRIYLVSAAVLSFIIPMIQASWVQNLFITQQVKYTLYSRPIVFANFKPIAEAHINFGQVFAMLYLFGIIFLLSRLILQLIKLDRVINHPETSAPFSFFKNIRVDEDADGADVISAHEQVHAKQWHSADVLLIELVMIVNWFNPVVYFYRLSVKHIHEFIADREALKAGTDKADYALLLLSQTFNAPTHRLVNPFFSHSLLKQRIIMLQKNNSHRISLIKYGLSAPLFILMLILSSATINNSKTITIINDKVNVVFATPATAGNIHQIITTNNDLYNDSAESSKKDEQALTADAAAEPVFTTVEHAPEFPGGMDAFGRFLGKMIRYPTDARNNNIQGRVIVTFVVERDGSLSDVKAVRGIGYSCDEEACRVIKLSPKWTPGLQNGQKVRVQYSVPISFYLAEEETGDNKAANQQQQKDQNNSGIIMGAVIKDTTRKEIYIGDPNVPQPIYILDGKETPVKLIASIDAKDIEKIEVLKDSNTTKIYGDKAKNGVVLIYMKKKTTPLLKTPTVN